MAKEKKRAPNLEKYKKLRDKYLRGNELTVEERKAFRMEADSIAQDLKNRSTISKRALDMWFMLPTSLQQEVKGYRAARIAKKYGISDLRKFMSDAVPQISGIGGTIIGGSAGGLPGAQAGGAIGSTVGHFGTALANKLFPGGPENPETFAERDRLRKEVLLDYYQPQQKPVYLEDQADPEEERILQRLRQPIRSRSGRPYRPISSALQSAAPILQDASMQPEAQNAGAQTGLTGLWNRLLGRTR